jgi:hypothetical protein
LLDAVLALTGERGRWLAAQHPDWDYVLGATDETAWETGSPAARLALLRRVRAADPNRARGLLNQTWPEESPDDRATLLGVLETHLSMADEPFLEMVLDDRRKEVRQRAADLLVRLPTSRLVQRMIARAQPLLAFRGGWRPRLDVTLPAACDKAMIRDGIEPKPSAALGEKAWWLCQMLGAIPPSVWCDAWNTTPPVLIKAAAKHEWERVLLDGWRTGAQRSQDAQWAEAMVRDWPELAVLLPPARREAWVLELLKHNAEPLRHDHPALGVLSACHHPWSVTLTRAVLAHLPRTFQVSAWTIRSLFKEFALYIPPSLVPEVERMLSQVPAEVSAQHQWAEAIDEFLAQLQFRYEMLKEIAP